MRFTIVNFVYLFYTIVKGFYLSKLLSVTSTNVATWKAWKNKVKKKKKQSNHMENHLYCPIKSSLSRKMIPLLQKANKQKEQCKTKYKIKKML